MDFPYQTHTHADGLYICTQDFDGAAVRESCYSIPKADLLLAVPSVANLTRFESGAGGNLTAVSGSWQPARNLGGISLGRAALLGAAGGNLQRNDIFGATGPGAFLSGTIAIAGDPGHAGPPPARQPPDPAGENNTIENVAPRFVANPVIVPGHPATTQSGYSMWAAHAVQGSAANSAIQWYEIDEGTDTVLQSGLIDDPDRDFHEPSIGANEDGQVVIGYTCSGSTLPASACASVGDTDGTGTTNFQSPAILFAGSGHYYRDGCVNPAVNLCSERNRWGDYSATVTDPSDACTFWTFQEYTAQGATVDVGPVPDDVDGGQWGIRVVELIYTQCLGGDLAVTKVCKPDTALRPGETAFCDITVTNFGPGKALGVSLLDRILSDGTFTLSGVTTTQGTCTTTPNPQVNVGEVECDLGQLAKNDTVSIHVDVNAGTAQTINDVATVTSESDDPDPDNNIDEGQIIYEAPTADLRVLKDCKPDEPMFVGETATCTIFVDNLGTSTAQNVDLIDAIVSNANFELGTLTTSSGACASDDANPVDDGAANITCSSASLAAGARITITVPVTGLTPGDINDIATVSSDTLDPDNSNNQVADSLLVLGLADLAITKADLPDPVVAGTNLTYDLTVTNNGPSTAVNVVISDALPAEVAIVSVSSTGGGACNAGDPGNALLPTTCTFDSLINGASEDMTIVVLVAPNVPAGTILHNDAEVSSDTIDTNNANDLASTDTTVDAEADLEITKTDSPDPVLAGAPLTYTVKVENLGPSTAVDVMLMDTLPAAVSFVSVTISGGSGTCVPLAGSPTVVECDLGDFGPGDVTDVVIDVSVDPATPDGTTITNSATVSSTTTDPVPGNNAVSEDTLVETAADLWIEKTGNFPTGNPSGTILYRITVNNLAGCTAEAPTNCGTGGPSDAQDVVVVDALPNPKKKVIFEFANEGCTYDADPHEVTCELGTIPVGQSVFVDIQIRVKGSIGEILNTATVSTSTTDPTSGNNTHELLMSVGGGDGDPGGPGGGRGKGPKK